MHCPRCDARVPPRAEFCPQCHTPISPGLRERLSSAAARAGGAGRGEEELKRNRRNLLVIGAAFFFGLVIGGQSGWFDSGIEFRDLRGERPAVVEAQELFQAYRDNDEAADDRFDDRFMVVTGEFVEVRNDDQGNPDLRLRTSDPAAPLGIDLVRRSHDEGRRLEPGQIVTVGCEGVARTGEERWLRDCAIEAVRPAAAAGETGGGEADAEAAEAPAPAADTPAPAADVSSEEGRPKAE